VPTYEYTCGACGADQDIVQAMTDPTLTVCPLCSAEAMRKRFTNVGVVFKGSGFYRNDARSGSASTTEPKKADASSSKTPAEKSSSSTPAPASSPSSDSSSSASTSTKT